ncbi:MAG: protein-L-isoaspartate(D-aspartate) O-methyltransferase [Planctomycetota bacterium]
MIQDQLVSRGIRSQRVLDVIRSVARERFVDEQQRDSSYADRALPIAHKQTISQPYIVAFMTEILDVQPDHRVLEIGTGTGYQTAILSKLARRVFSIERIEALAQAARIRLDDLGLSNVELAVGDGSLGWPEYAPFDRIMVTASALTIPQTLTEQLAPDGRMIIPVGPKDCQRLTLVVREDGRVVEKPSLACRFVKLRGRFGW